MSEAKSPKFTRAEFEVLLVLAAVQFVNLLDFVIMMPLAPRLMTLFQINPEEFSHLIASYGIAASLSAIAASFFIDRFDRRTALAFLVTGFTLGTAGCGFAPNFEWMLAFRILAGIFGGVMGSVALAIVGDRFAAERRGTAMGVVMSSFALVSVLGIPFGLYLADEGGPFAPFQLLALLAALLVPLILLVLPKCTDHLKHERVPPIQQFLNILGNPRYQIAYLFGCTVVGAGFLVIPFLAAYMVHNIGIPDVHVKWVYLASGACTLISMNVIGRLSDRYGKKFVFRVVAFGALAMSLAMTHLPPTSLWVVMAVCAGFMVLTSGRVVPAQALVTGVAPGHERAGFMSLNAAVQHFALSLATIVSGKLVTEGPAKELIGYGSAGVVAAGLALASIVLVGFLRAAPAGQPVEQPEPAAKLEPVP